MITRVGALGVFALAVACATPIDVQDMAYRQVDDAEFKPTHVVAPVIPPRCWQDFSGDDHDRIRVTVGYDVDERGRPRRLEVLSSDDPCFDEAALRAVSKWRYPDAATRPDAERVGRESAVVFAVAE